MRRQFRLGLLGAAVATFLMATPALACGGLIGPNGAVNLLRTTTFVGYHDGVEHYVTAFKFQGGGGAFGSLTPLPGVPTTVEKGGDWTLQRLIRETEPIALFDAVAGAAPAARTAEVLMEVKIDALNVTILRGGAAEVGTWATDHGFRLPPDAPEVLDFYARRSPIFLAAAFDADAAAVRGQAVGDGTSVHVTIPTANPWVPIRILALGKHADDPVDADVYMLTDRVPALLPATSDDGLILRNSQSASAELLTDLRSDRGMEWVPQKAWLTKLTIAAQAEQLSYDLAVDVSGRGVPSRVMAGLDLPGTPTPATSGATLLVITLLTIGAVFAVAGLGGLGSRRPTAAA